MTTRATGTFEVKLAPQGTGDDTAGSKLGRRMMINIADGKHSYDFEYTLGGE